MRKYIVETRLQHGKDDEEFICLPDDSRKAIIAEAVGKAIDWCIENGVLKEFFQKYREEAASVSILEYSAEKHLQVIKEEGLDEGITGAVEILKKMGIDIDTISEKICEQYHLTSDQAKKYL